MKRANGQLLHVLSLCFFRPYDLLVLHLWGQAANATARTNRVPSNRPKSTSLMALSACHRSATEMLKIVTD